MKSTFVSMVIFGVLLFSSWQGFAQEATPEYKKIEIIQDSRVDQLVSKHAAVNQQIKTMDGFRIQLFSDSGNNSKTRAQTLKDELLSVYPEVGVYLTFKSPNYKVRFGDFRTRLDAQRMLNELSIDFPNAFIVTDHINLPRDN
jgi:hypothetical protein